MEPTLDQHGLDLYDELIKKFIENLGDIADTVPNDLIKSLWDREVMFNELVPVSGERHLIPYDKDINFEHFVNIFYDIKKAKENALTFTNVGDENFNLRFEDHYGWYPVLFQVLDDRIVRWDYDNEIITIEPDGSVKIVGLNPRGITQKFYGLNCCYFSTDTSNVNINISGNIMSLIDIIGETKEIPNKDGEGGCFAYLFQSMPIVDASELRLPAVNLAPACYTCLFNWCTKLISTPALPATKLASYCYYGMFGHCTSLETAPELPATTLAQYCCYGMFMNCTNLINGPVLLAPKVLTPGCYYSMFYGCTSLETAPELPATTLAQYCCYGMFEYCSSLKISPILYAKTLMGDCYSMMFVNCRNLSKITCLAEEVQGGFTTQQCTRNWVRNVAQTGTFIQASNANWPTGSSGIPNGWVVQYEEEQEDNGFNSFD